MRKVLASISEKNTFYLVFVFVLLENLCKKNLQQWQLNYTKTFKCRSKHWKSVGTLEKKYYVICSPSLYHLEDVLQKNLSNGNATKCQPHKNVQILSKAWKMFSIFKKTTACNLSGASTTWKMFYEEIKTKWHRL